MKTFGIKNLIWLLPVWALFFTSCSKDYTQVIPGDASLVVSIDMQSLLRKSGISTKTPQELEAYAQTLYNPGLKLLFQHPADVGISLTDKAYLFASFNKDEPTLVFKVTDKSKLEHSFKKLIADGMCDELEDHGDYQWTLLHGLGYCAFNKRVLMIVSAQSEPDNVIVRLNTLMKQSKSDCITHNKAFKKMEAMNSDMNAYISFESIPQATALSMMMGVPQNMSLRDMRLLTHINFVQGRVVTHGEYYTENKDLQKYLLQQAATAKPLNKTFLGMVPAQALACMSMNIPGDKVYSLLMGFDTFKQEIGKFKMNPEFHVKDFFNSINGDITMALTGFNQYGDPELLTYVSMPEAKVANALKNLTSQMKMAGMSLRPSSVRGQFVFDNPTLKLTLYAGVGKGYLYLTNDANMKSLAGHSGAGSPFAPWLLGMKQQPCGYILFNMSPILQNNYFNTLFNGLGNIGKSVRSVLGSFTIAEAYNQGNNKCQMNIYMKDHKENVLKKIFE